MTYDYKMLQDTDDLVHPSYLFIIYLFIC